MEERKGFSIEVTERRVKVTGDVDAATTPLMIEAVMKAMTVELDLSEVSFVDSYGLTGLIKLRNTRAALEIIDVSPEFYRTLERAGLVESLLSHDRVAGSTFLT